MNEVKVELSGHNQGDFRSDSNFLLGSFSEENGALAYRYDAERVLIQPWGKNSFRVCASKMARMPEERWALTEEAGQSGGTVTIQAYAAEITNGKIRARINNIGKISFTNDKGETLLEEYVRNRQDVLASTSSSLEV